MSGRSIRARLTGWYVGALALAVLALGGGSWWLLERSVTNAVDASLRARVDSIRQFIAQLQQLPSLTEIQDEFREFGDLTMGEILLDVRDPAGIVLCRPSLASWDALRSSVPKPPAGSLALVDREEHGRPFRVVRATLDLRGQTYDLTAAQPIGPFADALGRFKWLLGVLIPTVLLAAGLGGYAISRRALAPVDRMTRAAQAITLRNLDQRLEVPPADDELRRLATTFNDMLARLQASVAEMVRLTAEASHELRTPVSLVRATAEVALGRERSADDYRQALGEVLEHAERLSILVGDLLMLARADAGVEPVDRAPVDVAALAREAGRDVQAAVSRASLTLDLRLPASPVIVDGQPDSLRRLLLILLDNAVKYTPAGGRVTVAVDRSTGAEGGEAVVRVIDTGIGIEAVERPRVFDRFYRGTAARARAADGSGLGLAIARTIVERHEGAIDVSAAPGGRGCQVTMTLPLAGAGTERSAMVG